MPNLKDKQNPDAQYDPYGAARDLYRQEHEAIPDYDRASDGLDDHPISAGMADGKEPSSTKNIDSTREGEEAPSDINYTGGSAKAPQTFTFRGVFKKKGPLAGLLALLLGGGGGIMMLFSPGLAAVQLKEVLTGDLNDQLAAMDIRTNHVFKAKFNDMGKGICKGVKVRCGFKGMSDRQVKRFRKAGIEVETEGKKTFFRKNRVKSLTFTDSAGNKIKITNPKMLNRYIGEAAVRNSLRKAFNPKFAGFYDAVSDKVFGKVRTSKADKLTGNTDKERAKSIDESVRGEGAAVQPKKVTTDSNNDGIDDNADKNRIAQEQSNRLKSGGMSTKELFANVAKNGVKSAGKGLMLTGAADTACTVKNTARAVEAGAKIYRSRQLIRYAMVFLTFADGIKAGTVTPEQAEFAGNALTATDTDKMIVDETSAITNASSGEAAMIPNPDYGKNAFDSQGYHVSAYNEAPRLTARSLQYTVGGGAVMGTLSGINSYIQKYGGGNCKVIQNNLVRIGSLVGGVLIGAVSFGSTLAISIGASVAIGMAMPLLENYLAKIVAGTVVDSKTNGVDAGNAIFGGTAALMGSMAMARGMQPANKSRLKSYFATSQQVKNEYIAIETEEAKKTPFDIYSQYSFLGSFARKLLPVSTKSTASIDLALASVLNIIPLTSKAITPKVGAAEEFNDKRFSQCKDYGYEELGIDADVFCNVRYGMSQKELDMDTDTVRAFMYNKHYVDKNGDAIGDYKSWVEECVDREAGWGEVPQGNENNEGNGENCIDGKSKYSIDILNNFRIYTLDDSIIEAMDYDPPVGSSTSGGASFTMMTYNIKTPDQTDNNSGGRYPDTKTRYSNAASIIKDSGASVIALQEIGDGEARSLLNTNLGSAYDSYPTRGDNSKRYATLTPIFWKTDTFELVEGASGSGAIAYPWSVCPGLARCAHAPWVKLRNKDTQQEFYVVSIHTTNVRRGSGGSGDGADQREETAKILNDFAASKNDPVFVGGDFNSSWKILGDDESLKGNIYRLPYCILGKGAYNNAYDLAKGNSTTCPLPDRGRPNEIDHLYATKAQDITASGYKQIRNDTTFRTSDHDPIIVNFSIPGTGDSSGSAATTDIAWPVDKKYWDNNKTDFLSSHTLLSRTFTSPSVYGIATDISSSPSGSSIYSMLAGKVISSSSCAVVVESKVTGGTLQIAYGHGNPKVSSGDLVTSGQEISLEGANCNASGPHVHIDMALNAKHICPQDVFIAMGKNQEPNWKTLTASGKAPCSRT